MTRSSVGMIAQFGQEVAKATNPETTGQIMAGVKNITGKTKSDETALWVKGSIDRLDSLVLEDTRFRIMESCGVNCSQINHTVFERGKTRRMKYKTEDEFLSAEALKPQTGTRVERNGNLLLQIYTPQTFTHPMRCYCGLLRGLPADVQVSQTYCHCSQAFVQSYWEEVLGHPVKVEIKESTLSGSMECKFIINLSSTGE